ncbi:MAG: GNAT family N-acetyltransferase [Sporolactobacillus sp.]
MVSVPQSGTRGMQQKILAMTLDKARALHLERVLITCNKNNRGSARTIINNGGILENEVNRTEEITQRYWIDLERSNK